TGGQPIDAACPIETMPLFVRAGSIIPYGPDIQYTSQTNDPIELRVYRGADGDFTLYEDEGDNYDYEKGQRALIPIHWNQAKQTLALGKRQGNYPGMPREHTFNIVWVTPGHGAGIPVTPNPDTTVTYTGAELMIHADHPSHH